MRLALLEISELGYTPAQAAKRNKVAESGISRQLNKPTKEHCGKCGQVIKLKKEKI
jgi:hypothetical protein